MRGHTIDYGTDLELVDSWKVEIPNYGNLPLPVELFGEVEPKLNARWLVKRLLMAGSMCVMFGPPGCGKSFLATDMGLHVGAGADWFGRRTSRGGVVLLAAEGQAGVRNRIEAWRRAHPEHADVRLALVPTALDLLNPAADLAKVRAVLAHLAQRWGGLALLIVDTLAASFGGGDENGPDMAAYVANVVGLCQPYGAASIIVHHAPLATDAKRPRGHSSLWGAADTVLRVTGDSSAPARRIHCIKQKDADPGSDILFKLEQMELGLDEDGEAVTSCIVAQTDCEVALPGRRRKLSAKEHIVFTALERTLVESGVFPPSEIPDFVLNRSRTGKVASVSGWRANALSALASPDTKADTARRTFVRARETLQAAEILAVWEDWAWLC